MTKQFGKDELREMFVGIGEKIVKPLTVYLLGGGAMCFRNQKVATKDLDLIFETTGGCAAFASTLEGLGFERQRLLAKAYREMGAEGVWRDKGDHMLDLFTGKVCGKLEFSEGMKSRAETLGKFGNLSVLMASNEDVVLFKGVTGRENDVGDIVSVIRSAPINWRLVLDECINQSEERVWHGLLFDTLTEIRDKHAIEAPIRRQLLRLDRKALIKEAYARYLGEGLSRKEAFAKLAKLGFTPKEIEKSGI